MRQFKGKVAVITGAASGIGRALAEHCAQEGMQVVLADIEEHALTQTAQELEAAGARVLAIPTDVSIARDINALAQKTLDTFGAVHLLFNNAGVGIPGSLWETSAEDWEWIIGVNLWGVIHGVRIFVPIMLKQDADCHIVNTASAAGLISTPGIGSYKVTKHGVVALSETLYHELIEIGASIKVSVLCPGPVATRIGEAERNRRSPPREALTPGRISPQHEASWHALMQACQAGMSPRQVAKCVFKAILEDRFYILTHPETKANIQRRMEDILHKSGIQHRPDTDLEGPARRVLSKYSGCLEEFRAKPGADAMHPVVCPNAARYGKAKWGSVLVRAAPNQALQQTAPAIRAQEVCSLSTREAAAELDRHVGRKPAGWPLRLPLNARHQPAAGFTPAVGNNSCCRLRCDGRIVYWHRHVRFPVHAAEHPNVVQLYG